MAKRSGYLQRLAAGQKQHDELVRDHMRTFVLDVVTITLGKLGMNHDDMRNFRDIYMETEMEYITEIRDDMYGNNDPHIYYARERIDRALKEVVPEDMFVPYDKRYVRRLNVK